MKKVWTASLSGEEQTLLREQAVASFESQASLLKRTFYHGESLDRKHRRESEVCLDRGNHLGMVSSLRKCLAEDLCCNQSCLSFADN